MSLLDLAPQMEQQVRNIDLDRANLPARPAQRRGEGKFPGLVEAVRRNVSDIHIFPNPQRNTEIHFRMDGQLQLWHLHGHLPAGK